MIVHLWSYPKKKLNHCVSRDSPFPGNHAMDISQDTCEMRLKVNSRVILVTTEGDKV